MVIFFTAVDFIAYFTAHTPVFLFDAFDTNCCNIIPFEQILDMWIFLFCVFVW